MPEEGEVGCEVSRAWKVRNMLLLQLWDDVGQGQVDLARVTRAESWGQCLDLAPVWLHDSKLSPIPPVPFSSSCPVFTRG